MTKEKINTAEINQKILPLIEKTVKEHGLVTVEVNFINESGKWHLKIFIYKSGAPVTHEDCEKIVKSLNEPLDEIIPIPYILEVSSPGTERKLKSENEYEIFKGERVKIKLKKSEEHEAGTFIAKIKDYSKEKGLTLELAEEKGELTVKNKNISSIKLEPEYNYKK